MIELLFDKSLRRNYKKALQISTKEQCDIFMSSLNDMEKKKLITYCDVDVKESRLKTAQPTYEYFLLHYEEYMSKKDFEIRNKIHKINRIITGIIFIFVVLVIIVKLL